MLPTQHPPNNNMYTQDHGSSMTADTSSSSNSNNHQQHSIHHHSNSTNSNSSLSNQSCSSICNNSSNQQQQLHNHSYPLSTHNNQQQPITLNNIQQNHQLVTSSQSYPPFANLNHHHMISQDPLNQVIPMESENVNHFTLVQRKKKKAKIDPAPPASSSSSSSCSSTPSNDSTSSTNASSIINADQRYDNNRSKPKRTQGINAIPEQNPTEISTQARRFAETRYPFPPFIVKFNYDINEKNVIADICNHYVSNYSMNLLFAGHRVKNKRELLLFVNNRESFEMLFDELKWPATIESLGYEKMLPNHLPPQFSVILRNVPMNIDINELLSNIKNDYPDVKGVHRISNKNKQPTSFVRLDINNGKVIDELIRKRFIYVNNIRFSITEYMAPAKVLVCTKCFIIGHFRNSCKSKLDYCKICGLGVEDLNLHKNSCDKSLCCVRCKGPHDGNDMRCPAILSFRAVLTKSLLNPAGANIQQQQNTTNYNHNDQDFPVLNVHHNTNYHNKNVNTDNHAGKRIDELIKKMDYLDGNLNRLIELNNNYTDKLARTQQIIMNHDKDLQLQQIDTTFQREFTSQFISPLCQVLIEMIPSLVKQNTLNDKTLLCPSLSSLCIQLANDLPVWTNRYLLNENLKVKIINDYNLKNLLHPDVNTNNNAHPPSSHPPSCNQ
jgi:hypothetical protein